jgi:hypothetical protein
VTELKGLVGAILDGQHPVPPAKPKAPEPVAMVETPPTQVLFLLRSVKFRDHSGKIAYGKQYTDCTMPLHTAQRALRSSAGVSLSDPRAWPAPQC